MEVFFVFLYLTDVIGSLGLKNSRALEFFLSFFLFSELTTLPRQVELFCKFIETYSRKFSVWLPEKPQDEGIACYQGCQIRRPEYRDGSDVKWA